MATNHTENYALNLWTPQDSFLREEFNENTEKIDAAIAARGNCSILFGHYVGTGEYGQDHPNILDFADTTGKAPVWLFVGAGGAERFMAYRGMSVHYPSPTQNDYIHAINFTWTPTGVSWYNEKTAVNQFNNSYWYYYIALFD